MISLRQIFFGVFFLFLPLLFLSAQDDFGFGFGFAEEEESGGTTRGTGFSLPSVRVSGEVSAQLLGYTDDFSSSIKGTTLGDVFSGKLNFSADGSNASAVINLNLAPVFDGSSSPVMIDEAYLRAFFGNLTLEGGLRKVTWGKADSLGPLDVINPVDYTDLTNFTNLLDNKIARPLFLASYRLGAFSKIEGVFVPWFEGHRFASSGRWQPYQLGDLPAVMRSSAADYITSYKPPSVTFDELMYILGALGSSETQFDYPDTKTLEYAQAGLRFITTVSSSDIGVQYYFGRLPRPAVTLRGVDTFWENFNPANTETSYITPHIAYNYYHQIGADYAQVIAGFNVRAELAANITSDIKGDDGEVYNPFISWSLGFDRDIIWGINLNLQATESIRLMHNKIGNTRALDVEAGSDITSTRITFILSRKFFRDELELKTTGIWGIEDRDFFILPAVIWTRNDVNIEFSAGFLGGDEKGELGQYRKNSFVRTAISYSF